MSELDQKQSTRKAQAAKLMAEDVAALQKVMGTKEGRRTIWRILITTGWDQTSYTGNSDTFKKEGQRSIGLLIRQECMRHCLNLYRLMETENTQEQPNV